MKRAILAVGLAWLGSTAASTANAQQDIQWKQVINLPKGLNQPQGVSLDILGLELGDTYTVAKSKLEKLAAESAEGQPSAPQSGAGGLMQRQLDQMSGADDSTKAVREVTNTFRLQTPGGFITASYVGQLHMQRRLPGQTKASNRESFRLYFSAPSSGHQVIGIVRDLTYGNEADQPRISETVSRLSDKLKTRPQVLERKFRYQFNDGQAFAPPNPTVLSCSADMAANSPDAARNANRTGNCDVVLDINVGPGISNDHARNLEFTLSDNERTRQNVSADFRFVGDYVRNLQSQSTGAPPKL